ncbi:hypothetical protein R9C00_20710 [Flammeovirgaceae bacterium SG7u.111]|nr:hypothetical protein [Flammeovirgaceae bacterium SG7u.132]WPO34124.1 hypothetical protein R9C00_20710 [Flammeovirgaceae bacterium SG7u.111]
MPFLWKKTTFLIALVLLLISLFLLLIGSDLLLLPILSYPYLPIGTLVAWIAEISFPFLFLWTAKALNLSLEKGGKAFYTLVKMGLLNGLLFGIIGYLLMGNWAFNGDASTASGAQRMLLFWINCALPAVLPLLGLLWLTFRRLVWSLFKL